MNEWGLSQAAAPPASSSASVALGALGGAALGGVLGYLLGSTPKAAGIGALAGGGVGALLVTTVSPTSTTSIGASTTSTAPFVPFVPTGPVVDVSQFGGLPTAQFFSMADGRWYQDQALTVEATDDAVKVQAAVDYAIANSITAVHLPSGNWYFKTRQGTNGEFVRLSAGGFTFYGDGVTSEIHIAPGFNSGAAPVGYTCVLGNADAWSGTAVVTDSVRFTNFAVDHNEPFNQWDSANYSGQQFSVAANAAVMLLAGTNIEVDHVTCRDFNGTFEVIVGTYGDNQGHGGAYPVTTFSVHDCTFVNCGDANQGDASLISIGANSGSVMGNTFTHDRRGPTPIEVHGHGIVVSSNSVQGHNCIVNVAGDSLSSSDITVTNNTGTQLYSGVVLFSLYGRFIDGLTITSNTAGIVQAPQPGIYGGITSTIGDGSSIGYGGGFFDATIQGNTFTWQDAVPAPDSTVGISWVGNTGGGSTNFPPWQSGITYDLNVGLATASGYNYICTQTGVSGKTSPFPVSSTYGQVFSDGGVTWMSLGSAQTSGGASITGNTCTGFGGGGIVVSASQVRNSGNRLVDVQVTDNILRNCGPDGIQILGVPGDVAVQFQRLACTQNTITGDPAVLQTGVLVSASVDAASTVSGNTVSGYAKAAEFFDTTNYPNAMGALSGVA